MGGDVGGRGREGGKRETCWVLLMARDTSKRHAETTQNSALECTSSGLDVAADELHPTGADARNAWDWVVQQSEQMKEISRRVNICCRQHSPIHSGKLAATLNDTDPTCNATCRISKRSSGRCGKSDFGDSERRQWRCPATRWGRTGCMERGRVNMFRCKGSGRVCDATVDDGRNLGCDAGSGSGRTQMRPKPLRQEVGCGCQRTQI